MIGGAHRFRLVLGRLPVFEISPKDEEFPPDLHYRDALFLDNPSKVPGRVARSESRAGDVPKLLLQLAYAALFSHQIPPSPAHFADDVPTDSSDGGQVY